MPTKPNSKLWRLAALLMLITVAGCQASLPPAPPVIGRKPKATPLPASVSLIDPKSSQAWLTKASSYLSKAEALSKRETPK